MPGGPAPAFGACSGLRLPLFPLVFPLRLNLQYLDIKLSSKGTSYSSVARRATISKILNGTDREPAEGAGWHGLQQGAPDVRGRGVIQDLFRGRVPGTYGEAGQRRSAPPSTTTWLPVM